MPVFIADHLGDLTTQSEFLRPIHIGSALYSPDARGPEPDNAIKTSISKETSFADIRIYHHIRHTYDGLDSPIAIMQRRRMFLIGDPQPGDCPTAEWMKKRARSGFDRITSLAASGNRENYLNYLAHRTDADLMKLLEPVDFVANRMHFSNRDLATQYLLSSRRLFPDRIEYRDAWHDLRKIMERRIGIENTQRAWGKTHGYLNNVIMARWPDFCDYYTFLFDILDQLTQYRKVERLFGYLAERIFCAYLMHRRSRIGRRHLFKFLE